jgi:hypothetical protein
LFALSAPNSRVEFVYLAYIPAIIFWGLDGFFLWQEQLFRKLYDRVRVVSDDEIDFSMDTSIISGEDRPTWASATISKTLVPFGEKGSDPFSDPFSRQELTDNIEIAVS